MLRKIVTALSAACLLAGCSLFQDGEIYPMPANDVRAALLKIRPMSVVTELGTRASLTQGSNDSIGWKIVNDSDHEIARVVATIEEVDEARTRVIVSAGPPHTKRDRMFAESLPSYPKLLNLVETTLEEQIDARLENRSFDMAAIQGDLVLAAVAMMQDQNYGRVGEARVKLAEDRRFNGPDANERDSGDWADSNTGNGWTGSKGDDGGWGSQP